MDNLCYLIQLFKEDAAFSKYLLSNLLNKMQLGKKLDFESFLIAFTHSLQHKDYLSDLVDVLFSYEQFYTSHSYIISSDILKACMTNRLYE